MYSVIELLSNHTQKTTSHIRFFVTRALKKVLGCLNLERPPLQSGRAADKREQTGAERGVSALPAPPRGCFLVGFMDLKTSNSSVLGGAGVCSFVLKTSYFERLPAKRKTLRPPTTKNTTTKHTQRTLTNTSQQAL